MAEHSTIEWTDATWNPVTGCTKVSPGCDRPGPCTSDRWAPDPGIHWIIAGGESGPGARPMHPDWVRTLREQCHTAGTAFFFKQWGQWAPTGDTAPRMPSWVTPTGEAHSLYPDVATPAITPMFSVGKRTAGREIDGRTHDDYPHPSAAGVVR